MCQCTPVLRGENTLSLGRRRPVRRRCCQNKQFLAIWLCNPVTLVINAGRKAGAALQALEETFLVARLAIALYSYLGLGTRWTGKFLRLVLYATLLLPGFMQARPNACAPLHAGVVLARQGEA